MKTKDELLKMLREDPMYQKSLTMASSADERKKIESIVESFVSQFASAVIPAFSAVASQRSKTEEKNVVMSGSAG